MKLYYECSFFDEEWKEQNNFSVFQNELLVNSRLQNNKFKFDKIKVEYICKWQKQNNWDSNKPTIIIPTKDQFEMMSFTCKNLKDNKIDSHCNIIIVDDRSKEDIKGLTTKNGFSYLRVDNSKGFNFSMLNNIPAKICQTLGVKEVIFWNSDLWVEKEEYFLELLKRHREANSVLSGAKLLYPPEEMSFGNKNIEFHFPNKVNERWRKTIQFGGDAWINTSRDKIISYSPIHFLRFSNPYDPRVNCDKGCSFITGALQLWKLQNFCDLNGFNPTLAKNFQDADICLRSLKQQNVPNYFGKNLFFYHDESPTMLKEGKIDKQLKSDQILFGKIWNDTIHEIIL